jgi:hypothetical protein
MKPKSKDKFIPTKGTIIVRKMKERLNKLTASQRKKLYAKGLKMINQKPVVKTIPKGTIVYIQFESNVRWKLLGPVKVETEPYIYDSNDDPCNKSGLGNG